MNINNGPNVRIWKELIVAYFSTEPTKTIIKIASIPEGIRTGYLPNASQGVAATSVFSITERSVLRSATLRSQ
jgi:hypothetical protein